MSDHSAIEWTDATWNPTTGCTKVSPACAHCYIERTPPFRMQGRRFVKGHIPLQLHENRLTQPLRWKKPKRIFVNSLSDLFHDDVPDDFIDRVFATMTWAPQHTFQVLTKRADRMRAYFSKPWYRRVFVRYVEMREKGTAKIPDEYDVQFALGQSVGSITCGAHESRFLPNVWLGVSVENQHFADERIPLLLQTPAAVRFISAEPLLGPLDICFYLPEVAHPDRELAWVIAGGESGANARPSHPDWFRSLRDQCQVAGVAFHFKQWGEWAPSYYGEGERHNPPRHGRHLYFAAPHPPGKVWRFGKKAAGRLLDGREWNEFPAGQA